MKEVAVGNIVHVGRNQYAYVKDKRFYKYEYSDVAGKVAAEIKKEYPSVDFQIFELTQLNAYNTICETEIAYRGIDCTPKKALMDTINSALCIATRGKIQEEDFPNYLEGSNRVTSHIFAKGFSMEKASRLAPKVIYMATCLLTGLHSRR